MLLEHIETIRMLQKINWLDIDENESNDAEIKFNLVLKEIEEKLRLVQDAEILREIIEKDESEYFMPIATMFRIYQRLIQLVENKRPVLENFASYLMIYGVDWEDEAKQINTSLDNDDVEKATQIALKVDYDKYQ